MRIFTVRRFHWTSNSRLEKRWGNHYSVFWILYTACTAHEKWKMRKWENDHRVWFLFLKTIVWISFWKRGKTILMFYKKGVFVLCVLQNRKMRLFNFWLWKLFSILKNKNIENKENKKSGFGFFCFFIMQKMYFSNKNNFQKITKLSYMSFQKLF